MTVWNVYLVVTFMAKQQSETLKRNHLTHLVKRIYNQQDSETLTPLKRFDYSDSENQVFPFSL